MPTFTSDGLTLSYSDDGEGEPILLIHGFASNRNVNWRHTGWIDTLTKAGRRVIAIDNRGHGESEKPHDPALYRSPLMAGDARRLIEHLGFERADVMGYSMGARISAFLALAAPERVRSVIFGGLGSGLVDGVGPWEPIVEALEAPSIDAVTHRTGMMFRKFAEQTGADLRALAACMRASRQSLSPEEVGRITAPALVAVGTRDVIAGSAEELARLLPHGEALEIPDRDHMLAVGDKVYKAGVLAFLERRP
ncbi:alpha/beta fold hydrolase [Segnochrobactrum spirostomi]|uniref:Alpha/beta hydrolase n=1 Tax=Segnochrobactrum spirostomi TaxID=2608987 RepID=A0A6A7XXZ7_9HYPH|nr:alpha/beta hydrolase [Segnochrobactrum spirostomi]MQT11574.1 alpha/beta hydrolase [Segnochrobactrum spirostomi]